MEILGIILGVALAFRNRSIAKSKGYQGRWAFVGGLTLGIISTIYCKMQDKTIEKQAEEAKKLKELMKK